MSTCALDASANTMLNTLISLMNDISHARTHCNTTNDYKACLSVIERNITIIDDILTSNSQYISDFWLKTLKATIDKMRNVLNEYVNDDITEARYTKDTDKLSQWSEHMDKYLKDIAELRPIIIKGDNNITYVNSNSNANSGINIKGDSNANNGNNGNTLQQPSQSTLQQPLQSTLQQPSQSTLQQPLQSTSQPSPQQSTSQPTSKVTLTDEEMQRCRDILKNLNMDDKSTNNLINKLIKGGVDEINAEVAAAQSIKAKCEHYIDMFSSEDADEENSDDAMFAAAIRNAVTRSSKKCVVSDDELKAKELFNQLDRFDQKMSIDLGIYSNVGAPIEHASGSHIKKICICLNKIVKCKTIDEDMLKKISSELCGYTVDDILTLLNRLHKAKIGIIEYNFTNGYLPSNSLKTLIETLTKHKDTITQFNDSGNGALYLYIQKDHNKIYRVNDKHHDKTMHTCCLGITSKRLLDRNSSEFASPSLYKTDLFNLMQPSNSNKAKVIIYENDTRYSYLGMFFRLPYNKLNIHDIESQINNAVKNGANDIVVKCLMSWSYDDIFKLDKYYICPFNSLSTSLGWTGCKSTESYVFNSFLMSIGIYTIVVKQLFESLQDKMQMILPNDVIEAYNETIDDDEYKRLSNAFIYELADNIIYHSGYANRSGEAPIAPVVILPIAVWVNSDNSYSAKIIKAINNNSWQTITDKGFYIEVQGDKPANNIIASLFDNKMFDITVPCFINKDLKVNDDSIERLINTFNELLNYVSSKSANREYIKFIVLHTLYSIHSQIYDIMHDDIICKRVIRRTIKIDTPI